ncbi:MAG: TIGR04423 family type III CRISPR-associated protein [Phocaeicola sp.]|nr:TIGR04423 family type III CRISPR-associated protein [Phocaeicola sp.]
MNQIKINEIDLTASYQGYIWLSDASKPIVLDNGKLKDTDKKYFSEGQNPFIIEGQLFDGKNSFSIKNVDGKMIVVKYEVDTDEEPQNFVPNSRMGLGDRKLKFLQKWEVEPNADCENMDVLVPAGLVFLGFTD